MSRLGKSIQFVQSACKATVATFTLQPRHLQPWNGASVSDYAMPTSPFRIDHQKTRVHETKLTIIHIATFLIIITFILSPALFIVPKMNPTLIVFIVVIGLSRNTVMNGWGFSFLKVSASRSNLMQCKGQTYTFMFACHDKIIVVAYVRCKVHCNINFPTIFKTRFVMLVWGWFSTLSCAWELDAGIERKQNLAPFCTYIDSCAWVVFQELFFKSGQIWK